MDEIERYEYRRDLSRRDFSAEAVERRTAQVVAVRQVNMTNLVALAQQNLAQANQERRRIVEANPEIAYECARFETILVMCLESDLLRYARSDF